MSVPVTCVVQARSGSTRLPGKVLAEVAGRPMLGFMLDRLRDRLEGVQLVVATSDLDRDDAVAEVAQDAGVAVVRGPEADVLERFRLALEHHPADTVARLTGDCPLVDPALVAQVIALREETGADYACNVLPRTFPRGLDVEVLTAETLAAAAAEAADHAEREHVTPFVYRRPERFRLANLRSGEDLGRERWTVDTAEDLGVVRELVAGLPADFGWRDVLTAAGRRAPREGLVLRPAGPADSERVLAWRNDPETVRWSRTRSAVEAAAHQRWFAARAEDPATRMYVAEIDAEPVASVRFDVRGGVGEVSLAVDPARRGEGIGKRVLGELARAATGDQQVTSLRAAIDPANGASVRVFESAGFRRNGAEADGFAIFIRSVNDSEGAQ